MGTRSLTFVYEDDTPLVCMYRQFDGYPTGQGKDLAEFLKPFNIINGIGLTERLGKTANGMGCLAAQLVAHFKTGVGGIYIVTTDSEVTHGQEYEYHVHKDTVIVLNTSIESVSTIFSGTWEKFEDFCNQEEVK